MSCSMEDEDEQIEFGNHASFCWDLANYFREENLPKEGTFKEVGMDVVARYNHDSKSVTHTGKILYISKYRVILDVGGIEWHGLIGDYIIEPLSHLTIPLVDGEAYQFEHYQRITKGVYCEQDKVFYSHPVFYELCSCSSIEPLTVGDK